MIIVSCLLLFLCIALFLFFHENHEHYDDHNSSCIVTMTTFMGYKDRFQHIEKILTSLIPSHHEIIVINEWDENYQEYMRFMRQKFPNVKFIQKTGDDSGQARSLNILIRDHLLHSRKKYWIHWEDTWLCSRPLVPDLVRIMEKHPQICQLQVTDDWKNMSPRHIVDLGEATILLPQRKYEKDIYQLMNVDDISLETWPLFSLRPSINRLSFFQRHPNDFYFLEHPHMWPLRFEWEFGRIFLRNQGVKAITKKPYAKRIPGYKSTYQDLITYAPHTAIQ